MWTIHRAASGRAAVLPAFVAACASQLASSAEPGSGALDFGPNQYLVFALPKIGAQEIKQ
jgi:hypothetical protein